MALANVNITNTFDVWRVRTNQIIVALDAVETSTNASLSAASAASIRASAAFDKANSANLLAFNTGIGANAFASATIAGANAAVGTGANAYATAATAGANAYMISVQNGSNTAVGTGANAYATAAAAGANAYMISVQNGSNTAVGAGANAYATAAAAGANTIAIAAFSKANSSAIAINNDVVNTDRFIGFVNNSTGNASTINVSSTGLTFNPSTRTLTSNNISIPISLGIGTSPSGTIGEIRATSDITAYYSDSRLKTIISTISNPVDKVNSLSGIIYINNDVAEQYGYNNKNEQIGVVAQEVEAVLPQIVKLAPFDTEYVDGVETSKSGKNYKTVQYDKLIPLLIEAIKELSRDVQELKKTK